MNRVLIVSDSHGDVNCLNLIRERHTDIGLWIHCGDSELPVDAPELNGFTLVGGNCDFDERYSSEELVEFAGRSFLITHGHRFSVKSTLMNLHFRAKETGAEIVCFGHSHFLGAEIISETLFLNPGSIRLPRGRKEKTYIILELTEAMINVEVWDLVKGEMKDLNQTFELPVKQ